MCKVDSGLKSLFNEQCPSPLKCQQKNGSGQRQIVDGERQANTENAVVYLCLRTAGQICDKHDVCGEELMCDENCKCNAAKGVTSEQRCPPKTYERLVKEQEEAAKNAPKTKTWGQTLGLTSKK